MKLWLLISVVVAGVAVGGALKCYPTNECRTNTECAPQPVKMICNHGKCCEANKAYRCYPRNTCKMDEDCRERLVETICKQGQCCDVADTCQYGLYSSERTCSMNRKCDEDQGWLCYDGRCCESGHCPPGFERTNIRCGNNGHCPGSGSVCRVGKCCKAPPECPKRHFGEKGTCNRDYPCPKPWSCKSGRCCLRLCTASGENNQSIKLM